MFISYFSLNTNIFFVLDLYNKLADKHKQKAHETLPKLIEF